MEALIAGALIVLVITNTILLARHEYLMGKKIRLRRQLDETWERVDSYAEILATLAKSWEKQQKQWEHERTRLKSQVNRLENVKSLADAASATLSKGAGMDHPMTAESLSDLRVHDDYGPKGLYAIWKSGDAFNLGRVDQVQYEMAREKIGVSRKIPMDQRGYDLELDVQRLMQKYPQCGWEVREDPRDMSAHVRLSETAWIYCGPVIVGEMQLHEASRDLDEMLAQLQVAR